MSATRSPLIGGPAATVLAASIARRYYLEGATKSAIADEFGLSRFKVARLLEQARASGLVRIELHYDGDIDLDLSTRLRDRYGLRRCLVSDSTATDDVALRAGLGRTAADLLSEIVTATDVVGLAWSRTLLSMRSALRSLAPCTVVQLTGALSRPGVDESSIELVRDVARIAGGAGYWFYAPMILSEPSSVRSLLAQSEVARAFERFGALTVAMLSIGAWDPTQSTVAAAIGEAEYAELARLGVCAEMGGIQLDVDGRPVRTPLSERNVGIDAERLRAVPEIIVTAYGRAKARAVRAAIRGGLVTSLVTHASLAEELLRIA
ncbi:MAG TPA: sugar-binding domain-containing protein [Solirubrobacteraceae bacterium]|nr:sugar-binding domain-containing protein [Solirubrobacteraceae bacterium]